MPGNGLVEAVLVAARRVAECVGFDREAARYRREMGMQMDALYLEFTDVYAMPNACCSVALSASWRADFLVADRLMVDVVAREAPVSHCIRQLDWTHCEPLGLLLDFTGEKLAAWPFMLRPYQPLTRSHWPTTVFPSTTS